MEKKDRIICIFLFLAFLGAGLLAVLQLNIPPVIDEVGTLANSAYLVGYDWTQTSYTMGGFYYKYGMAIFYAPFLIIFRDPYKVYKCLLSVNVFFFALTPVIAYIVMKKHLTTDRLQAGMFSAASSLLPSVFMFQTYAKSDAMLAFIPWTVLYVMLELLKIRKGKKRIILSVILSLLSVYAYTVHTRGLVVIIAVALTVVIVSLCLKRFVVNFPAYILSTGAFLIADKFVSKIFYDGVYGLYGTAHASAESFDFDFLKKIFTADGFSSFMKLTNGWLFDGLTVTCGMIGVAVFGGIAMIFVKRKVRQDRLESIAVQEASNVAGDMKGDIDPDRVTPGKDEVGNGTENVAEILRNMDDEKSIDEAEKIFGVFSVLHLLGVFGMGLLFFFVPAYKYYMGIDIERSDRLIYERYIAAAFGPAVLYGFYLMFIGAKRYVKAINIVKIITTVGFIVTIVLFMENCVDYIVGQSGCVRYFVGMSTFLEVNGGTTSSAFENIDRALLIAGLLGLGTYIVMAVISSLKGDKKLKILAVGQLMLAVSVVIILVTFENARLARDEVLVEYTEEPVKQMIKVQDLCPEAMKYPILLDRSAKSIKHYQFQLKAWVIGSYRTVVSTADNCFILAKKKKFIQDYYDDDYYIFDKFNYKRAQKDIVYVKGHELAQLLMDSGFKLTKYEGDLVSAGLENSKLKYTGPDYVPDWD